MAVHDMLMAAAGGTAGAVNYIDDCFSSYLYTGNGSTQTITNGIDLSTKGGLVWLKNRTYSYDHALFDTSRSFNVLNSNTTAAQQDYSSFFTSYNSNGFSIAGNSTFNVNNTNVVSWTFRKQAKFFDVVTWTGTGVARTIAHNLGSTPGTIIVKNTSYADAWYVYHRSLGATKYLSLNTTAADVTRSDVWNDTEPTSSVFSLGDYGQVNRNGDTYVAYLFAHDAGGFGTAGTDNVISCGSYTGTGSEQEINLGYEPQLVIRKCVSTTSGWTIFDNMRGFSQTNTAYLYPNLSNAESNYTGSDNDKPTATGFKTTVGSGQTWIYIAIRRPMKPPTTGTEVFSPIAYTGNATANTLRTAGFPVDMVWGLNRDGNSNKVSYDRLRGAARRLAISSTAGETSEISSQEGVLGFDSNVGYRAGQDQGAGGINFSGWTYANAMFKRAPGFFDIVCDTGTGSAKTVAHNLTVAPELIIRKSRTSAGNMDWWVYASPLGATNYLILNATAATSAYTGVWNDTAPTSTEFTVGNYVGTNASGASYVSYLFATVAGVSKVGSYTGTGTTHQINCGFSSGARFVMIRRTDGAGNWYVYDTARGIVSGNDPYLFINDASAEDTSTDFLDPYSAGFELSGEPLNVSGWQYLFLAIA